MKTRAFFVLTMMSFETVMVKGWPMYQPKPKALGAAPVICPWSGSCSQQGTVQKQHGGEDAESRAQRPGYKSSACCPLPERPCMDRWQIFLWAPAILLCALMNTINFIEHSEHQVKSCIKVLWMCAQDPMYPLKVQYVGVFPYIVLLPVEAAFPSLRFKNAVIFPSDYLKDCVYITVLLSCSLLGYSCLGEPSLRQQTAWPVFLPYYLICVTFCLYAFVLLHSLGYYLRVEQKQALTHPALLWKDSYLVVGAIETNRSKW